MNKLIKILIPGSLLFTFLFAHGFACSNQMAAFRIGGLHAPARLQSPTFNQLMGEYGSASKDQGVTYDLREIGVAPETKKQCVVGELDIVAVAIACHINAPFIITVKDAQKEVVLMAFGLNSGQDINALIARLTGLLVRSVVGNEIDIFACIDSNSNGSCADEPIIDLNRATADILGGAAGRLCDQTKFGVLLFHKHHSFSPGTSTVTVPVMDIASQVVQDSLRNLSPQATTEGGRTIFPLQLVKADHDLCPKPAVRTDGCFAKGTKISLAKEVSIPIEELHPGNRVLLADGRVAMVKRVTAGPEPKPMVMFETSRGQKIMITSEHPLLTAKGVKLAKDIAIGDQLKSADDGKFVEIVSIGQKAYTENVYNFELEGKSADADHLVVAEGLVSGELYLQNKMSNKGKVAPGSLSSR